MKIPTLRENMISYGLLVFGASLFVWGLLANLSGGEASDPLGPTDLAGEEVQLVLLVSAQCYASGSNELLDAFSEIRKHLSTRLDGTPVRLVTLGVALDLDVPSGLDLLQRFGGFDEVSVGRSWMNQGAVAYLWREVPGPASIPQVLVVRRVVELHDAGLSVGPSELLGRAVGMDEISQWGSHGPRVDLRARANSSTMYTVP